jgi:hypothetical protein
MTILTLVAVLLVGATRAQADPSLPLDGPGDFSGSEVLLDFDDLGLVNGNDVPSVAGVDLTLSDGAAAKFMLDAFPREFGPEGAGSVNNFWGYAVPYPDLAIRFSGAVHRLGFELRANDQDDVALTLLSSGSIVDEVTIASRGSDQLYFYGFENAAGFDQVLVDLVANASGAFTLDNLRFESLGVAEEGPPKLFCVGFTSPWEALLEHPRYGGFASFWKHWLNRAPVKVLRAWLLDAEGLPVTDADLFAPPVARVLFTPAGKEEALDVTAQATWKDSFVFARRGYWRMVLQRRSMMRPGTYLISMESGDEAEYLIDPTCSKTSLTRAWKHHFWHR